MPLPPYGANGGRNVILTDGTDVVAINPDGSQPMQRTTAGTILFKNIAAVAVTAGSANDFYTPTTGKSFVLLAFQLSLSVAGSVKLIDGSSEFLRTGLLAAGTSINSPELFEGYTSTAANNHLKIDVTANGSVSGFLVVKEV